MKVTFFENAEVFLDRTSPFRLFIRAATDPLAKTQFVEPDLAPLPRIE